MAKYSHTHRGRDLKKSWATATNTRWIAEFAGPSRATRSPEGARSLCGQRGVEPPRCRGVGGYRAAPPGDGGRDRAAAAERGTIEQLVPEDAPCAGGRVAASDRGEQTGHDRHGPGPTHQRSLGGGGD